MVSSTPSETTPCAAVLEHLDAAIDGELGEAEAARIEAHLGRCASCADEHRLALAIKSELHALPSFDAPSEVIASVLRQVESAQSESLQRTPRQRTPLQRTPQRWLSLSRGTRRTSRFSSRNLALAAVFLLTLVSGALWLRPLPDGNTITETAAITKTAAIPKTAADPLEVARATEEARYALAYIKQVHRRAGLKIRQDLLIERLVQPTVRSLSLSSRLDSNHDEDSASRPDRS